MRLVALAALAALLLGSCVDSEASPPTRSDLADIDLSPDHTITVSEDGYDPAELEVESGEVILLVNDGDEPHSFAADDEAFDTGRLLPGEDTTLVITEPGTHAFHDVEDPDRRGTLTVLAGQ
jgi:plastocyanin